MPLTGLDNLGNGQMPDATPYDTAQVRGCSRSTNKQLEHRAPSSRWL
jgi:hypothetical protein